MAMLRQLAEEPQLRCDLPNRAVNAVTSPIQGCSVGVPFAIKDDAAVGSIFTTIGKDCEVGFCPTPTGGR
jgi:hypothetical protein